MIKVFQTSDKYFASNGDKIINPYKAVVFKEDNGDYYCDIEAQIDLMDYLKQDMIACVQTPWGWQPFRCDKPEVNGKKVRVRAWHLYYDTESYVIADTNIVDSGCQAALNQLKGGCDSTLPFSVVSDIADIGSFHCIRQNFAEAVNSVLGVWGGHLDRDGWNIGIRTTIGQDRGVTLAYGKNIKEITAIENWDNVCTKILPVGKNEVTIGFLTSDVQYDLPYTKVVEFTQDLEQGEDETDEAFTARLQADLQVQAAQYLADHALPEVNYTLKAHLQDVADVGDTIWVKHPKCQVDVETHVISVKWDAIKGEYKEIEFGNFRKKLSGLNSMVTAEIKKAEKTTESFVNEELRKATDKIMGVMGNSYVIYDGDKILIVDKLPKEEAKNVIRINSAGIGFSNTGINGTFNSAWTINGTFDAQQINVINLNADAITTGTLAAERVGAGSFTITGGSINIATSGENYNAIILNYENEDNGNFEHLQLSPSMILFNLHDKATGITYVSQITPTGITAPNISAEDIYMGGYHLNNHFAEINHKHTEYAAASHSHTEYAAASHLHSNYYESGDNIRANYLYIASLGSNSSATPLYISPTSGIVCDVPSSSRRYKNSIQAVDEEMLLPEKLYSLPVRQYKWNEGHFMEDDGCNYDANHIGFIAEEVAEFYPYAAVMKNGVIETWDAQKMIAPMLQLIQDQKNMIDDLTERVEALEGVEK